jgi:hypothetical protein
MFHDPSGKSCVQPADGKALADYLTQNYRAFQPNDTKADSALGVYITFQDAYPDPKDPTKLVGVLHHYCKNSPCYKGRSDCILSVALYNRHVMLDGGPQGAHMVTFAGRCAGYVLNTSKAENKYNKCAYMFDGASSHRLYYGCGNGDTVPDQTKEGCAPGAPSAYNNICLSTGKTCTPEDKEVQPRNNCEKVVKPDNPFHRDLPVRTGETPCYFTGPAFRYPDASQATQDNKIRKMIAARIADENPTPGSCADPLDQCPGHPPEGAGGQCCKPWEKGIKFPCNQLSWNCNRLKKWNEIVMDLRPMMDDLKEDPNGVIVAFVYGSGCLPQAKALRTAFETKYRGPGHAPLIHLDQTVNVIPTLKLYDTPFKYLENPTREQVGALTWDEADEFERWMMSGTDEPSTSV